MTKEDHGARRGTTLLGGVTVFAIVAVVVVVSLPRLHGFAVRENERDALVTAQLLAHALGEVGAQAPASVEALVVARDLQRQLADSDFLEDGRLLRRHGYLFRFASLPAGATLPQARPGELLAADAASSGVRAVVLAWPWAAPRTGREVLAASPAGGVWSHSNAAGTWSGPGHAPSLLAGAGWRRR